jgi:hypothetical protein
LWVSYNVLFNVGVVWSGEGYADGFVFGGGAHLTRDCDGFVEVNLGAVDVCGYMGSIATGDGLNNLNAKNACDD